MNDNYEIFRMTLGVAATNGYFFYRKDYDAGDGKHHGIYFDPPDKGSFIYDQLAERDLAVDAIFLTHGHFDHIGGVKELKEKTDAKVYCHEKEEEVCGSPKLNSSVNWGHPFIVQPDELLRTDQEIEVAGMQCKVLFTPGHTQGGACFYFADAGVLFAGDTLFHMSIGRTDLPTGSMMTLLKSIREQLFVLPDDTVVLPGHMDETTIGFEKQHNPFLA